MTKKKRWTRARLITFGVPGVLIPGILLAITLGWNPMILNKTKDYYAIQTLFPKVGVVKEVYDGDTFQLTNGVEVRLIGIDAPARGKEGHDTAKQYLIKVVDGKRIYLEYDRYQDDKFGRMLAWVWVDCEKEPVFLAPDYMHLSGNASREGLMDNPDGCKKGKLVNEVMIDRGFANIVFYQDRGELKYEERLRE